VSGLDFRACRSRAAMIDADGAKVPVLGLDDLIVNRRAAGRPKDLLDMIELERIRRGG
jgi:predicted nucleotidyltransferase